MKLVVSSQAEGDLESIADHIAQHNAAAAERLVAGFRNRWRQLPLHPHSGPPRDDIAPGVRHLLIGEYVALYRIEDDVIQILRVLHGRRDLKRAIDLTGDSTG